MTSLLELLTETQLEARLSIKVAVLRAFRHQWESAIGTYGDHQRGECQSRTLLPYLEVATLGKSRCRECGHEWEVEPGRPVPIVCPREGCLSMRLEWTMKPRTVRKYTFRVAGGRGCYTITDFAVDFDTFANTAAALRHRRHGGKILHGDYVAQQRFGAGLCVEEVAQAYSTRYGVSVSRKAVERLESFLRRLWCRGIRGAREG
jgi:hypothetical protein